MKLRFTPEELIRECLEYNIADKGDWEEKAPDFWVKTHENFFETLKNPYFKVNPGTSHSNQICRIAKCEKGWLFIKENQVINFKQLTFGKKHREKIKEGYSFQAYVRKSEIKLFITNTGICQFKNHQISRYLSLATIVQFQTICSGKLLAKMISIRTNNEWLEKYITGFSIMKSIPMAELRECSSFQKMLTKINLTDHPVSAEWFINRTLEEVFEMMVNATYMHNPVAYFKDNVEYVYEEKRLLTDTLNMAKDSGIKFYYNMKQIKEKHDEMLLASLEANTTIPNLTISTFWRTIHEKFFENWELIESGKRLKKEGIIMKHCVGSYHGIINNGSSCIFTIEYNDKRYTLELIKQRGAVNQKIQLSQCKGYANSACDTTLMDQIIYQLKGANEYLEHNKIDERVVETIQEGAFLDIF